MGYATPTSAPGDGLTYTQVSAAGVHFTCGLRSNGSVVCWGYSGNGLLTTVPVSAYGIDTTAPAVVSSVRANPNPTTIANVQFTVTFSEFVVGVDVSDFTLNSSGLTGASITSVSGSGQIYTITVNTGTGTSDLRLDVVNDGSIRDAVNLPLDGEYIIGDSYTIAEPTATSTPTETPTVTMTPSETAIPTESPTMTSTLTETAVVTKTKTATPTPTSSPTQLSTATHTPTPTVTNTLTRTRTPSHGNLRLYSIAAQDGWVLEKSEMSETGGSINSTSGTFILGDSADKKQYRSILSFKTSTIPDNATITSVMLLVKRIEIIGTGGNPLSIFKGFMADVKNGTFGFAALQAADFQTAADGTLGPVNGTLGKEGYHIVLTPLKANINKLSANGGLTQIRLRFRLDDNNNTIANQMIFYSGNASNQADRPQLVINYTTP